MAKRELELEQITKEDPLAFAISYMDLLDGKEWEVENRGWMPNIYDAINPYRIDTTGEGPRKMALLKPTQVGMSTMALAKMLHFAYYWPSRTIYTLPRQQDVTDFVGTRVDPTMKASTKFQEAMAPPDSSRAKGFAKSFIFFMELTVEPRMMPADMLMVDEVDLSNPDNMGTAINRLDDSDWALQHFFGTPTIPNYGVDALYQQSDMKQWMVKCEHCNAYQVLDWDKNLRVVGSYSDPDDVYFGCVRCDRAIEFDTIQRGEWVARRPKLSNEFVGFHISQMYTHSPMVLYKHHRDPLQSLREFWRKRLGRAYEISGGSLTREDILANCFQEPYEAETVFTEGQYFMGVDQGNELQVVILKPDKDKERLKVVHVEIIPFEDGFDRVKQLIRLFNVRLTVIDADPNRHSADDVRKEFPGRVYLADYTSTKEKYTVTSKGDYNKKNKLMTNVGINRGMFFDDLIESFGEGVWQLPGEVDSITPDIELFIDHLLRLKRDIITERTPAGEKEKIVWRALGPDHLAHAGGYAKLAAMLKSGKGYRARAIGVPKDSEEEQEEEQKQEEPKRTRFIRIRR